MDQGCTSLFKYVRSENSEKWSKLKKNMNFPFYTLKPQINKHLYIIKSNKVRSLINTHPIIMPTNSRTNLIIINFISIFKLDCTSRLIVRHLRCILAYSYRLICDLRNIIRPYGHSPQYLLRNVLNTVICFNTFV